MLETLIEVCEIGIHGRELRGVAWFDNQADATKFIASKGECASAYGSRPIPAVKIDGQWYRLISNQPVRLGV